MTKIFKKVFPFLLQLGCDVERVRSRVLCGYMYMYFIYECVLHVHVFVNGSY